MELEALSCNNCGAPIQVPQGVNYVNCTRCGSRLAVRRAESVHYTEVVGKVASEDGERSELEELRIQNELLRLDQDWEEERKQHLVQGWNHRLVEPSEGRAAVIPAILVFFAILFYPWRASPASLGSSLILYILSMIAASGAGLYLFIAERKGYQRFKQAADEYYEKRETILSHRLRNRG